MSIPEKLYVGVGQLQEDSYELAARILESGFFPDVMVSLFRGGVFIGNCIHETFNHIADNKKQERVNHIDIRTSKYYGIDKAHAEVQVYGLNYLTEIIKLHTKVLIVDDIFDTGLTIDALLQSLRDKLGNMIATDIRVATVYYKPTRNKTERIPDYYIYNTTQWVVFPHEVEGMSLDEILISKGPTIHKIFQRIMLAPSGLAI
jgi:hypoxanthine phosphoribosyltransferase